MLKCKKCHELSLVYSIAYDAHYCPACNIWLEQNCNHPSCSYCRNRPEKPIIRKEDEQEDCK